MRPLVLRRLALARLALGVAFGALGPAEARAAPPEPVAGTPYYMRVEPVGAATPCSGATVLTRAAIDSVFDVDLPFPFTFYDTPQTRLTVSTDGAIGLPESAASATTWNQNLPLGSATRPNGVIAPWWDSLALFPANQAEVAVGIDGAVPHRTLCVRWRNVSQDNGQASSDHRFDVTLFLHEGPAGRIDVEYGAPPRGNPGVSVSASVGMEDPSGRRPISWAPNDGRCGAGFDACPESVHFDLSSQRVTLLQDAGRELVARSVSAPRIATLGAPIEVEGELRSLHAQSIGPFDVAIFAAPNPQMTGAVRVGGASISLQPFETRRTPWPATAPSGWGATQVWFQIVVDANRVVSEPNENDNARVAVTPTRLVAPTPDLAVERVTSSRARAEPGQTLRVDAEIVNQGSAAAAGVPVAVMLSSNPAISRQDVELSRAALTLEPGARFVLGQDVEIPSSTLPGRYHLGALADPQMAVAELDESNNGRASLQDLVIDGGALAVATEALPPANRTTPYGIRLLARGGRPPYRWLVVEGDLPDGLRLDPDSGAIEGLAARAQSARFTVEVRDADAASARRALSLEVTDHPAALTVVTRELPPARLGRAYAHVLLAAGATEGATVVWSSASVVPGLQLRPNGALVGQPTEIGTFDLQVEVRDQDRRATRVLQLDVTRDDAISIVPAPLAPAPLDAPYEARLEAEGGLQPRTWRVDGGALPPGLRLSSDGVVSGSATRVGRFRAIVEVRDGGGGGPALRDVDTVEIEVLDPGDLLIVTRALPAAAVGVGFAAEVRSLGGTGPYGWMLEGLLPEGLSTTPAPRGGLRIAGIPQIAGRWDLLVRAEDGQGRRAARAFTLDVAAAAPPPSDAPADGCRCTADLEREATAAWLVVLLAPSLWRRRRRDRALSETRR